MVAAHGTARAPQRLWWRRTQLGGTISPFPPPAREPFAQFLRIAGLRGARNVTGVSQRFTFLSRRPPGRSGRMRCRRDVMYATQTRQYEMLLRVRDFGNTHRESFAGSIVAQQAFAAVGRAIDDLTAADMRKLSASMSARAGRKA